MTTYQVAEGPSGDHDLHEYSPLVAQLLWNRGFRTKAEAEVFLNPNYDDRHDPFLMKDLDKAIARIKKAIDANEKITIYADYDADGIPGSVVLGSLFDKIGYTNYDTYLPHRHDEGYGIHIDALNSIKQSGTSLVVTIDVGITGHEAATWCKENDIDLIITDHHLPTLDANGNDMLPDAFAVVNPKRSDCDYPDPMLCGAGVAFKLAEGFLNRYRDNYQIPDGWEKWLLDLVGMATVSDMVPLVNENRILATYGLLVLKKTKRPGLKKLMWDAGISIKHLDEEDIGFGISPKINAASRMSHPEDALAVLKATDDVTATAAVAHLTKLNNDRKRLVAQTTKAAYAKLEKRNIGNVIVVGSSDWQAGILGLVASKLVERYHKPAFVWSEENGEIKGSCRTWNGTHLVDLMSKAVPETFLQFGGHAEAGGFSCAKAEVHFLEERLNEAFLKLETTEEDESPLVVDIELNLDDVTMKNYQDISQLAPFGVGNPKPVFMFRGVVPTTIGSFGKTKEHLEISFEQSGGKEIRAIAFFKDAESFGTRLKEGSPIDLVAHIEHSVFRGKSELRLKIIDIQ